MIKKEIGILGSTGSIGSNAVNLLKKYSELFYVKYLIADSDYLKLAEQALELMPEHVVIANEDYYQNLKDLLKNTAIKVYAGRDQVIEIAKIKCDLVLSAIVGAAGLEPTYSAISSGNNIALANKECLVCAGDIMMKYAEKNNVTIIPVDSEHNAIMQIFDYSQKSSIEKMVLTASGGPFLHSSIDRMNNATIEDALKHPSWQMGKKISIDSATMFNKGLEIIEAYHLFNFDLEKIDVLVHPQSIIHGMVYYKNGSVKAQMSVNDMSIPIFIALMWPQKIEFNQPQLDLVKIKTLEFLELDHKKFPAVGLARSALLAGGNATIILNAANEIAVQEFLLGKIKFLDIAKIVDKMLSLIPNEKVNHIDDVLRFNQLARRKTQDFINKNIL